MGENGSKWGHGWTPENTAAVRLKLHEATGSSKRPAQRQQRLKDVKPSQGSFLPLPTTLNGKPATAKPSATVKPKTPRKPAAKKAAADPMAQLLKAAKAPKPATAKQPSKTTEQLVHDAVHQAAANATGIYSGKSVTVADARDTAARAGINSADFDRTLMKLHDNRKLMVTSSNASMLLTAKQRNGGIKFGGVNNQIISLE